MRRRGSFLRWLSISLILISVALAAFQLVVYSRVRTSFPPGLVIAGVPVGGLDRQRAAERLLEVYSSPVELQYNEAVIHMNPSVAGFELNLDSMLAAADLQRTGLDFWSGYWDFLWGRREPTSPIPLDSSYSEARLRTYLTDDLSARYDQPATSARPKVGTVNFLPGKPGTSLDVDISVLLIESALRSTRNRVVALPLRHTTSQRLPFGKIETFLKQTLDLSGFDGLVGMYVMDLQTAQEIHFAYQQGAEVAVNPDVSFTAASIIKIPIMVSIFKRISDLSDPETTKLLEEMIEKSGNDPADWVMQRVIDPNLGPLAVTEDMQSLGLENTFLAGHFYAGAPLLVRYKTPANQRSDVDTRPDPYNQTTTSDIGMLLTDIYQCAQGGGGALVAVFPGAFTQAECQLMITFLTRNRLGALIEAGTPDGTQVAHKHGWVSNDGVINTIGDAGIVYTPGGNYVFVTFMYHPVQLVWDPASKLLAELSAVVYNYFNMPAR